MTIDIETLKEILDPQRKTLRVEGGKVYFTIPQNNVAIDLKPDARDKRTWSKLRRLCYDYIARRMVNIPSKTFLLDVGMGQAQFKDVYDKCIVVGADYYPYPDVSVVCDFTQALPFKEGVFDVVIASNVLEHLPNPESAMKEYARVLRPGGVIIGAVPFLVGLHQEPYDFHRYTHFMLEHLMRLSGVSPEDVEVLGTAQDAYLQVQKKMFDLARDTKNRYSDFPRKFFVWAMVGVFWGIQRGMDAVFSVMLRRVGKTHKFPAGYGFTGIKK